MDKESLMKTLEKATANAYDVYLELYTKYFENGGNPAEALEIILDYPREIGDTKDRNPKSIKLQDEKNLMIAFDDLICGMADRIAELNYTKEEFYKKLYEEIFCSENEILPQSTEEKVIALKILSEHAVAVPYFQIDKMESFTEDEFEETATSIHPQLQEAFCMLQRQFSMMPEMVSQLLRIADGISDRRERIVFWTMAMSKFRSDGEE